MILTLLTLNSTVFWDVAPCCLAELYWRLLGLLFDHEDRGSIFLRNIGKYLTFCGVTFKEIIFIIILMTYVTSDDINLPLWFVCVCLVEIFVMMGYVQPFSYVLQHLDWFLGTYLIYFSHYHALGLVSRTDSPYPFSPKCWTETILETTGGLVLVGKRKVCPLNGTLWI